MARLASETPTAAGQGRAARRCSAPACFPRAPSRSSRPALQGALEQARRWAEQHPERQMVTVLATDGFPTLCEPLEIPELAELARAALPVRTFVIGVFSRSDLDTQGRQRLDQIASAGGSEQAIVVNAAGDVTGELANVGDASACGSEPGWYYVQDAAGVPVQLRVCPTSCEELRNGKITAELQVGCATRIR